MAEPVRRDPSLTVPLYPPVHIKRAASSTHRSIDLYKGVSKNVEESDVWTELGLGDTAETHTSQYITHTFI